MARELALILSNGNINSAVTAAVAAQQARLILVYADPSSDAEPVDRSARAAFESQVAHFKPYREHTLSMPFLGESGHGMPAMEAAAPAADPRRPPSVAPALVNLLPLVAAGGRLAAAYGAASLYLGLRVGPGGDELARAAEYVQIWNELLQMPCGQPTLTVETPLLELEPWQVVDLGVQVSAPLDKTWSCDEDADRPCNACPGCQARAAAFTQAAKPDPQKAAERRGG